MFQKKIKLVAALLSAAFVLSQCSEPLLDSDQILFNEEKVAIATKNLREQYMYVRDNLSTIRKALLPLTQNREFRNVMYSEIEKQFDGDENVLIRQLLTIEPGLAAKLAKSQFLDNAEEIYRSLDAFNGIGTGKEMFSLYPQIYIHNFFNFKNEGFSTPNPTLVVFDGDGSNLTFEGLRLTGNGQIEKVSVDEAFANENEVWVISLNDNYNGQKMEAFSAMVTGRSKYDGDCISTPSCDRTATNWAHINLNKLAIDCRWETWVQGDADVAIALTMAYEDYTSPNTHEFQPGYEVGGSGGYDYLLSVDESELGNCYEMFYTAYHGANPLDAIAHPAGDIGDLLFYTIFEHDNWPVPIRYQNVPYQKHTWPVTNFIVQMPFRGDGPYFFNAIAARYLTSNCSYFGCIYHNNHACDQFNSTGCGEVNWKTGQ